MCVCVRMLFACVIGCAYGVVECSECECGMRSCVIGIIIELEDERNYNSIRTYKHSLFGFMCIITR